MTVPPISMSAVALRLGKNCTADCSRSTSSIAFGISSGLLAQQFERLGIAQQRQHAVRDGVDRGVMTGDQQQHARWPRPPAGDIGPSGPSFVHQLRQHAVAGLLQVPLDQVGHVLLQRRRALACPSAARACPSSVAASGPRSVPGHEVEDPVVERGFVLQRNTQDLADHRHRHRIGVLVDDVEAVAALGLDLVEQSLHSAWMSAPCSE